MKFFEKHTDVLYVVFRVLIGLTFLLHGLAKAPGILSGATPFFSLFWFAGVIEIVGGAFLIVGLFVQYTALISALEMLVAYFYIHVSSGGLNPLANKGEAALLFFAAFLVLLAMGSKKWSLDAVLSKRR